MSDELGETARQGGTGIAFLRRVYRTSAYTLLLLALMAWVKLGAPAALGLLVGGTLSLALLAGVEWTARGYLSPQPPPPRTMLLAGLAKTLGIGVALAGIFTAAMMGWVSVFAVLAGFAVPHAVAVLKLVGQKLRGVSAGGPPPD